MGATIMGVVSSASKAISKTFDTVTEIAETVEKSVGMATQYVNNRAKSQLITDKQYVIQETAKTLLELDKELNSDANLKSKYQELLAEW